MEVTALWYAPCSPRATRSDDKPPRDQRARTMMKQLWNDEGGFTVAAELVLIATILVIGMITGLTSVRDAVITELADVGGAIGAVNQSYNYGGASAHCARTAGSAFADLLDFCDTTGAAVNTGNSRCISLCAPATPEGPFGVGIPDDDF
jgi:Flp pilus assembly pilin Flp